MNLKKIISKGLIIGLLFNNISYSFANTKSLDGRYETFEGNNITINNILEEDSVNVKVEGNTLVNHIDYFLELQGNMWTESDDKYILDSANISSNTTQGGLVWKVKGIKSNTTYSFIYYDEYGTFSNILKTHPDTNHYIVKDWYSKETKKGINIIPFTTKEALTLAENKFKISSSTINATGMMSIGKNVMILEGDWTNKEIPEYFEGLKSVGEIENNKLEIKSENKNLFDIKKWQNGFYNNLDPIEINDNKLLITAKTNDYFTTTGATNNTGLVRPNEKKYLIKVKPNTSYTLSMNIDNLNIKRINYLFEYNDCFEILKNHNFGYAEGINLYNDTFTFTTTSNTKYIGFRLGVYNKGESITYSNIQLSENCVFTNYNAYVSNKKELNLKEPLRALPNGTKDKIIKRNGQWVAERNVGEVIFNGTEDWKKHILAPIADDTFVAYLSGASNYIRIGKNNESEGYLMSDRFSSYSANYMDNNDVDGITMGSTDMFNYIIRINKNKLDSPDINGFKKWLSENNVKLCYELEAPIYEPLTTDLSLNTYLETTYISNNSNIPANMKVVADRTINKATEAIRIAKENPTIENISQSRYWINLLKESISKDSLQNEIDNITEIEDLTIEPKKVSSSLDVYVKSKNSLTMSLSTNSIIFDGFTGVDDMEKLNAVNITVNSSLPYQLNSYMMTELVNKDNTKIISKELFNIRLNGESDYKAFSDINEKLVLKDDCERGNNNNFNIDLILKGSLTHKADVYKTTIKFEAEQK